MAAISVIVVVSACVPVVDATPVFEVVRGLTALTLLAMRRAAARDDAGGQNVGTEEGESDSHLHRSPRKIRLMNASTIPAIPDAG